MNSKIVRGTLIAAAGAGLFYLGENVNLLNVGEQWTPIVVALIASLVNAGKVWHQRASVQD